MTSLFNTPHAEYFVPDDAKAVLVLIHGMAEYSGRYDYAIQFLNQRCIGCVRFDLRGHGRAAQSERERGDVESFGDFVTDATAVVEGVRTRYPDLKLYLWGHSMGAIVATLTAARLVSQGPGKIRGVITSGPPIAAFDFLPKIALRIITAIAHIIPRHRLSRPFQPERLSRDLEVGARYAKDPLIPKAVTLRLLSELAQASARCIRVAPKILLPWLALHGSDDTIAPPIGSQRLIDALGSTDKQLRLWPGARHEVQNEIEPTRTEFLACIADWIIERATR